MRSRNCSRAGQRIGRAAGVTPLSQLHTMRCFFRCVCCTLPPEQVGVRFINTSGDPDVAVAAFPGELVTKVRGSPLFVFERERNEAARQMGSRGRMEQ